MADPTVHVTFTRYDLAMMTLAEHAPGIDVLVVRLLDGRWRAELHDGTARTVALSPSDAVTRLAAIVSERST